MNQEKQILKIFEMLENIKKQLAHLEYGVETVADGVKIFDNSKTVHRFPMIGSAVFKNLERLGYNHYFVDLKDNCVYVRAEH